jgi:hypothetical protein
MGYFVTDIPVDMLVFDSIWTVITYRYQFFIEWTSVAFFSLICELHVSAINQFCYFLRHGRFSSTLLICLLLCLCCVSLTCRVWPTYRRGRGHRQTHQFARLHRSHVTAHTSVCHSPVHTHRPGSILECGMYQNSRTCNLLCRFDVTRSCVHSAGRVFLVPVRGRRALAQLFICVSVLHSHRLCVAARMCVCFYVCLCGCTV